MAIDVQRTMNFGGVVAGSTVVDLVDLAAEDVHATLARLGLKIVQEGVA